jgi:non-specific serine/threonine protein kinase/serine/threonine-protein kinase
MGDFEEARSCFERALAIQETADPEGWPTANALWRLGTVLLAQGDRSGAEPLFERSLTLRRQLFGEDRASYAYDLACYHALTGNPEEAIRHLERAVELGHDDFDQMASDWDLRSLRGDPRFDALLERAEP